MKTQTKKPQLRPLYSFKQHSQKLAFCLHLVLCLSLALMHLDKTYAQEAIAHYNQRELEIQTQVIEVGAAPLAEYELWFTQDQGKSWTQYPEIHKGPPPIQFVAPSDGRFGFKVLATDRSGRKGQPPQPGTNPEFEVVIDTEAPNLEVFSPLGDDPIYAGGRFLFRWRASDPNLSEEPVEIKFRRLPDQAWLDLPMAKSFAAEASQAWWHGAVDGKIQVKISATDRSENNSVWISKPIDVIPFDSFLGSRVVSGDEFSSFRKFPIFYRVTDINLIQLKRVELWVRKNSGPWMMFQDPDRTSPFIFEAEGDGHYFFYLRAVSRNDLSSRMPPNFDTAPDHRSIVDSHPPIAELKVGTGSSKVFHQAGKRLRIEWAIRDSNLSKRQCRLQYSLDQGSTWRTLLQKIQLQGENGSFDWKAPLLQQEGILFRILAQDQADNISYAVANSNVHVINSRLNPKATSQEYYQRAILLYGQGDRSSILAAVENLDVSLRYDSANAAAYHDRGAMLMQLGSPRKALMDFTEAHKIKPTYLPYEFSLIRAHLSLHHMKFSDEDHLGVARKLFNSVQKVDIYRSLKHRELLSNYKFLRDSIKRAEEDRMLAVGSK